MLGLVRIQPVEPLVTFEDRHLPVVVRRDVGVRLGGQDGIGLRASRASRVARSPQNRTSRRLRASMYSAGRDSGTGIPTRG